MFTFPWNENQRTISNKLYNGDNDWKGVPIALLFNETNEIIVYQKTRLEGSSTKTVITNLISFNASLVYY